MAEARAKEEFTRGLGSVSYRIARSLAHVGKGFYFSSAVLFKLTSTPFRFRRILREAYDQGVASLPVILSTSAVTGMVLTLQLVITLTRFGATMKTPQVLALALVRELGPVLAALMFVGKAGGRMASELGTMSVNDQIKALRVMAIDPMNYLIVNRVIAGTIAVPLLVTIFDLMGIGAGGIMMYFQENVTFRLFMQQIAEVLSLRDLLGGWIKGVVFGVVVTLVCCYKGFTAKGGSAGVGQATTEAVATASIFVIVVNLLLTRFNMIFID